MRLVALGVLAVSVSIMTACTLQLGRPVHVSASGRKMAVAPPSAACVGLSRRALGLNLAAIGAGGWGGAGATVAGAVDDTAARWGITGVAAGLSIGGAVLGYLGAAAAARYSKECP